MDKKMKVAVFGAGPAGLTAGYQAVKNGSDPLILEASPQIGGIARTTDHNGFLFDLGGHRFFTKFTEVENIWREVLGPELLTRPRLSRIFYKNKFFYYPLKPMNALFNLGIGRSFLVMFSYIAAQIHPDKDPADFEKWVSNRFGRRLYNIFFKTYTEKVWGTPCREIQADWAAQRIKSLSLWKAVLDAFGIGKKGNVTTLIDEFLYPRRGPGQMWEGMRSVIEKGGGRVKTESEIVRINMENDRVRSVMVRSKGRTEEITADGYLSSLPLRDLMNIMEPRPPEEVVRAADRLKYRDFFTVGLIVRRRDIFPDNWIYIHDPNVLVGRIQNFKNWSPDMVPDEDLTALGLEYFCFDTDEIWSRPDAELIELGLGEAVKLGFVSRDEFVDGVVIRSPKSYPVYDPGYRENIETIRAYLETIGNLQTMGRNGLHRYNNMDHSMMTAIRAVGNLPGGSASVWDINVDDEYQETREG